MKRTPGLYGLKVKISVMKLTNSAKSFTFHWKRFKFDLFSFFGVPNFRILIILPVINQIKFLFSHIRLLSGCSLKCISFHVKYLKECLINSNWPYMGNEVWCPLALKSTWHVILLTLSTLAEKHAFISGWNAITLQTKCWDLWCVVLVVRLLYWGFFTALPYISSHIKYSHLT